MKLAQAYLKLFTQAHWSHSGAQPGGEAFGAFVLPEIFKTLHSNFAICRKLSKNKDEILFSNHFQEILLEFFFVLLVNYLLTRFTLR